MKKKVLLSSILTIALCFSLIVGSTFALFTSESEVDISVTAGKVDITAGIAITQLESVKKDAAGTITDEFGKTYSYETVSPTFTNGGTATVTGSVLELDNITPGDKVTFNISVANDSDVAIAYRYNIECTEGYDLMSGLVVYVNGAATGYESLASYTSAWNSLAAEGTIAPVPVAIELPVSAGNEYQDKTAKIRVLVEAVQGNANVDGAETVTYIAKATTAEDAMTALADPTVDYVCLAENMDLTIDSAVSNKTIDVNGSNANIKIAGDLSGVVITGIQDNDDAVPAVQFQAGATGDVTIADSYLYDHNSQPYGAVAGGTNAIDVTLVNCTLEGARPVYNAGNTKSLSILNCTIKNTSSWAVLINTSVVGDVVVDGCTFENCVGLLKVTGTVGGNFTFTNNEIVDCVTKNNFYIDVEVVGDITVSGNTMTTASNVVDDDVTEAEMLGIVKA